MTIGDRIKQARTAAGMTQEELGKRCAASKQTIFKYETGIVTNIPLDKIEAIADALDCSPAYLMGWEEPEKKPAAREDDELDPAIAELILQYRAASPQQQRAALAAALAVLKSK